MFKQLKDTWADTADRVHHAQSSLPFITLLLTIALVAITCAGVIYHFACEASHYRKWKDYDDCGLA